VLREQGHYFAHDAAFVVLVEGDLRLFDVEVGQQSAGFSRILAGDVVGLSERLERPLRYIRQIANRRSDQVEHNLLRKGSSHPRAGAQAENTDILNGIYQDDLMYIPFRLFARAFLPNFVRILVRKPDFRAFLILLLRAFSIVYPLLTKGHSGPTAPWGLSRLHFVSCRATAYVFANDKWF
jgi:hypothetical protein